MTLETKCILLFAIVARRNGVNIKLGLKVESKVFSTYQEHLTCYVGHKISDHMALLATSRSLTQWYAKIQGLIPRRKFNTYFFHFKMALNLSSVYSIDMHNHNLTTQNPRACNPNTIQFNVDHIRLPSCCGPKKNILFYSGSSGVVKLQVTRCTIPRTRDFQYTR